MVRYDHDKINIKAFEFDFASVGTISFFKIIVL